MNDVFHSPGSYLSDSIEIPDLRVLAIFSVAFAIVGDELVEFRRNL